MILSKKFVNDYVNIDDDIKTIAENMTRVGNEYDYCGKLVPSTNLVIGEVIKCIDHPKSDHLHVTKINIGNEILDIVCGAPNMREKIKVIVALDGAVLPGGIIKKREVLGEVSNGMCCSLLELGIDKKFLSEEDINGIHELPLDAPIGEDPIKYLQLDDEIIDFELTSNRADELSMIGLAYELGAIYDREVKEPKVEYEKVEDSFKNEIELKIETDNTLCFLLGRVMNVEIKESPLFIKNRLIACNIRPINNVVDISNYIMLETGQPLHFYDADKVGKIIGTRMAKPGEKLITLDNQERELSENDLVIFNEKGSIGLAGVMGGLTTEVDENTKNILIESAIFNPGVIRKTSKRILRSEASSRFEKGLDIKRTYLAMERSKELLVKYASGNASKDIIEYNTVSLDEKKIEISLEKINKVLGLKLTTDEIENTLKRLKFEYTLNNQSFIVTAPSRRRDILIKEDIIEEIGRIYGVDSVPATLPNIIQKKGNIDTYKRDIKIKLSNMGLSEVITYSLIDENDLHKFTTDEFNRVKVLEPMVTNINSLRYSLLPSLLNVYKYNKARNNKNVNIFEIGEGFYQKDNEYIEEEKLAILMSGEYISGINTKTNVDFYYLKGIIEELLDYLGYKKRYDFEVNNSIDELNPYAAANIIVNGQVVGLIGMIHPNIEKEVYVCEINLSKLRTIKTGRIKAKDISKYPTIKKDVSFIINDEILAKDIIREIRKISKNLSDINAYDEYKNNGEKSITFELTYLDENKTLTEEEVMISFNNMIEVITNKFKCRIKNM